MGCAAISVARSDNLSIGANRGTDETYALTGGALHSSPVTLGYAGTGTRNQTGGVLDATLPSSYTHLALGYGPEGVGYYNLVDGKLIGYV